MWGVGVWGAPVFFTPTCLESWGKSLLLVLPASRDWPTSIVQYVWQPAMVTWPGQFRTHSVLSIWRDNMSRLTQVLPALTLSSSSLERCLCFSRSSSGSKCSLRKTAAMTP